MVTLHAAEMKLKASCEKKDDTITEGRTAGYLQNFRVPWKFCVEISMC